MLPARLLLACAAFAVIPVAVPGQDAGVRAERAARKILADERYGSPVEFRAGDGPPPHIPSRIQEPPGDESGPRGPRPSDSAGGTDLLPVIIGAGVLALVVLIVATRLGWRPLRSWRRRPRDTGPSGPRARVRSRGPATSAAAPTLADAEREAAAGEHARALHLLLGAALAQLPPARTPCWTSREILGRIGPEQRRPLLVMVGAVERSLFGAAPAGARDWDTAREAWTEFSCGQRP